MKITKFLFTFFVITCSTSFIIAGPGFYVQSDKTSIPIELFKDQKEFEKISYPYKQARFDLCNKKDPFILGKKYNVKLPNGIVLPMTHFDRNSDTLIVLGHGFWAAKERWKYVVQLFTSYDVVIFDYRWTTDTFWRQISTFIFPFKSLCLDEQDDVTAIVQGIKTLKQYRQIIGLAECYSCLTFAMAQATQEALGKTLFTKLILDSALVSLSTLNEASIQNAEVCYGEHPDQEPSCAENCMQQTWVQKILLPLSLLIMPDFSISPSLEKISKIPILFIHGTEDHFTPLEALKKEAWDICSAPKAFVFTPYKHVRSMTDWGVYSYVVNQFIQAQSLDACVKPLITA